ncbi:MAG: ABC transporter ATP-binding protein [Erysipelotrichaceae bacterium]|nr:ABC transporter ATP-binding protein [Erysipelotrichaceae bacterium]
MYIKKYISPFKWYAIAGFFFKMCEAVLELMVPYVVSLIIDHGIAQHNTAYILRMGIVMYALAIGGYLCALVCQYFASYTSQSFGTLMRRDMYKAINQYDYEILDVVGTPTLITRLTNDVNQLQLAVAMFIRLISRSPLLIIGSIVMSFIINWRIALVFCIVAPLIGGTIYLIMTRTTPLFSHAQKVLDEVSLITRENLSGVRVIRAFNKQEQERTRFKEKTAQQRDEQIHAGHLNSMMTPLTTVIVNSGIIMVLYFGSFQVNTSTITQGDIVALINYMNQVLLSMYQLSGVLSILTKAAACYHRVQEVLDIHSPYVDGNKGMPESYDHLIEFDDVSFSYAEGHALSHISFVVDDHETIGIIGGTGSGKSTLVNLIPRFYEATEGSVKVKGQNVKDYPFATLRSMIGVVPQLAVLFSGTVKDNLLWGNKNATAEDIQQALINSQSAEIINGMPDGIDTMIEQGGKNISGGQRQRLTIARALIKNPEILILDDSASALDFATDAALRKALKTLSCTTIIVSQRVSALMHADHIIVLRHGELEGIGSHDELMQSCQLYQEIVRSQMEGGDAS